MDGSEGKMSFGGQDEAPAGAPPKNLGETGGWDPDAIEGLSFAKMEGKQDNDQGRSYAGLMTAEQHKAKKEKVAAEAFTQAEQVRAQGNSRQFSVLFHRILTDARSKCARRRRTRQRSVGSAPKYVHASIICYIYIICYIILQIM